MSFARTLAFQADAQGAHLVSIDIDNHGAQYGLHIVGLPDKAVSESKERVLSALRNLHSKAINQGLHEITVALAPAELPKHGPTFDVAIAIGILQTIGLIPKDNTRRAFVGELGLDGSIHKIHGALSIADAARKHGVEELYVPEENAREAALIANIKIYPAKNLATLLMHFGTDETQQERHIEPLPQTEYTPELPIEKSYLQIRGQETAKRGLLIAAAGGHNIALHGPPGTGKTLLARALIELLPPLSLPQMLETTMLHSIAGTLKADYISHPPLRAPHHTSSMAAIIGGGPNLRPGEIVLAHNGILFMDEFPEFQSSVIEALREPLEEGRVNIARAKGSAQYPTRFILVAAMNPCPCGFIGDTQRMCTCPRARLESYRRKLSGPIVDRIDMWIQVPRIAHEELLEQNTEHPETLATLKSLVLNAQARANERQGEGKRNVQLTGAELEEHAPLTPSCKALLAFSAEKLMLSPRALHRTIRLARTIADLDDAEHIAERHVTEALSYRPKIEI